ncbi:hypothetical protein CDN99_27845, partial [Roseateles aquatilis]
ANTAGVRNGRLFLKDHLGSVIGIVDEVGQLQQRMSYDAWGRRRNIDGSDDSWATLGTIKNDQDNSGYTGHEQLDQLGLVHMNARLYDPMTGRHTSADPTVPDPKDQQAFNRFSYVLNNALAYTDPTGLMPNLIFDDWFGADQMRRYGSCRECVGGTTVNGPLITYQQTPSAPAQYSLPTVTVSGAGVSYAEVANPVALPGVNAAAILKQSTLDLADGGYVRLSINAYKNGDYGWAVTYGASSVLWAGANLASFGTANIIGRSTTAAAKEAGAFSHLVPGGGLVAHEAAGGHLLARHLGQTEADLAARLASQSRLGAASTFASRAEAEAAISSALSTNAARVNAWVTAGARGRLVIDGAFSGGAVLQRGAAAAVPGTGVRAVLEGTGGGNWRIITGYPIP